MDNATIEELDELATWEETLLDPSAHPGSVLVPLVDEDAESFEPSPNVIDPRPPTADLVALNDEITALETQLATLLTRRTHLLASCALVKRLPPEILSRVFEIGVHDCALVLPCLSLVSTHWHAVALSTPVLWSYITLTPDEDEAHYADSRAQVHGRFMRKLDCMLVRSKDAKLSVDLDARYLEGPAELQQIMAALGPHLGRAYSFRVSCPDWSWMRLVCDAAGELGPALENVHLGIDPPDGSETDTTPCTVLSNPCPNLRYAVLEHAPLLALRTHMPALRALHVIRDQRYCPIARIGLGMRELLNLTSGAEDLHTLRLQSAHFVLDACPEVFCAAPPLATFDSLRTLALHQLDGANLGFFLDAGVFPRLTRLAVHMDATALAPEAAHWLARVADDATARFPRLRLLDLRNVPLDGPALVPLVRALHRLPALTGLALCSPPNGIAGARLFDLLAAPLQDGSASAGAWLLPRLAALAVQNCRDVSGHEVLRVVRARNEGKNNWGVSRVGYVKIADCFGLDAEVCAALAGCVDVLRMY